MEGLHNSFGEMAEHLVAPGIYKRFNELGYHFDAVARGGYEIRNEEYKVIAEVDVLGFFVLEQSGDTVRTKQQ